MANDADRIARGIVKREQLASRRAEREQQERIERRKAELATELRLLIADVCELAKKRGYERDESLVPVTVRSHRFPLLGDLFGDWTRIRGGWEVDPGYLLADKSWVWQGRVENPLTHPYLVARHEQMCVALRELRKKHAAR